MSADSHVVVAAGWLLSASSGQLDLKLAAVAFAWRRRQPDDS